MAEVIKDGLQNLQEEVYSFLLIGQSNMAGRGEFGEVEPIKNKQCLMLRMGRWQTMSEPINPDRRILEGKTHSGISLGASFANDIAETTGQKIGLIPCADGGTRLSQWMPGEILYDHAVMMTKLAMRSGELAGILWHQGEAESGTMEKASTYAQRFGVIIEQLQKDLGVQVPLVLGELGEYLTVYKEGALKYYTVVNEQLHAYAAAHPLCAVASSAGLPAKADGLHFCSASLRTFGERYFEAYRSLLE